MKHILLLLLSFFVPVVWGQQVEQFKLWPDKPEAGEAEIFVYHPAKGGKAAPAVLICPGGGYGHHSPREGEAVAVKMLDMGYNAIVLRYSLMPNEFPCQYMRQHMPSIMQDSMPGNGISILIK